jgi:class 3 adenylate cyclase/tetratricopeptide (TPR) repeat protein
MSLSTRDSSGLRLEQRRHITVLFSDISDYTKLTDSNELEACREVTHHLKRCFKYVVPKYGGTVVDYQGDGVMAMFGFPETGEHDGRKAVEAALELHDAFRQEQMTNRSSLPTLELHTGVHSALSLLDENDLAPGRYVPLGEAPNLASRLSDVAKSEEILVSAATLGADIHHFETRARRDIALSGKAGALEVLQVVRCTPVSSGRPARTPFVGRNAELALLGRNLERATAGDSREVAVIAPAGVGKTRLIEQFLKETGSLALQVCRGYCESELSAEPFQPFLQMVRQLARQGHAEAAAVSGPAAGGATLNVAAMTALPELEKALSSALLSNIPGTTSGSAEKAVRIFVDLFSALSRMQPLVLFIDDWQWADDASKRVLVALRERRPSALLVLTTSREGPSSAAIEGVVEVVHLKPFDRETTTETILTLQPDANPFAVEQIRQLSGGNALFIEELCHWTSREGVGRADERGESLPPWLSTLIESRIGRLRIEQAEVVRAAAVIGAVIPTWLLEQVTGHGANDAIVRDLAESDVIFPGEVEGTLRFKHGITRDVIYASVGLRQRQLLHRQIAELIEQRGPQGGLDAFVETLSYHFRAGAKHKEAAHYAERAAMRAMEAAAPDRARSQFAAALAALELLPPSDDRYESWSEIVYRFGLACVFDPTRDQLDVFRRATNLALARGDHRRMARAEYWQGFIHYTLGELDDAIDHYERARRHSVDALNAARLTGDVQCEGEMSVLAVQLLATVGQARAAAGQHDVALGLFDQALSVKRAHRQRSKPAVGSAYTLACKGAVLGDLGRFDEAYACFDEALDAIQAGHVAVECSIRGWLSAVYLWQGRCHDARESAQRTQALAHRVGSFYVLAMGQAVAAYATWMIDRTPASIDAIVRATSWLEAREKRLSISNNYGWLADMMAAEGREREARSYAALAIRRGRARDVFGEAMAYRALAQLPWRGHGKQPDEYLALAMRSALARGSEREQALTLLHQAQLAIRQGRAADARPLLDKARSAFAAMNMMWHDRLAERCLPQLDSGLAQR